MVSLIKFMCVVVRMDFERLAKDIESLERDRNSYFFHDLVRRMLDFLGFRFKESWFEVDAVGKMEPTQYVNIDYVIAASVVYQTTNFSRRERFERTKPYLEFIVATTNHLTIKDLLESHYVAKSIMSNSTFGLRNKIVDASEVKKRFYGPPRDPLALAFDSDYIVRFGSSYFLHPKYLYNLCLEKRKEKIT